MTSYNRAVNFGAHLEILLYMLPLYQTTTYLHDGSLVLASSSEKSSEARACAVGVIALASA